MNENNRDDNYIRKEMRPWVRKLSDRFKMVCKSQIVPFKHFLALNNLLAEATGSNNVTGKFYATPTVEQVNIQLKSIQIMCSSPSNSLFFHFLPFLFSLDITEYHRATN